MAPTVVMLHAISQRIHIKKNVTYNAMKLNASTEYFRLHTVSLFQRWTVQLTWLKFRARKMNEVSQLDWG